MVAYSFEGERFLIEDFSSAKTFASFLPAVAGQDGKPLWAFYANVGQAMGGFGVDSKDTPITPFDSANLAYSNIPVKGFRTLLKINGDVYAPFFSKKTKNKRVMDIGRSDFSISEQTPLFEMKVTYTSLSHAPYASLLRIVEIKNSSNKEYSLSGVDGTPIFFPWGLSNFCYKELVSLMAAYCEVDGLEKKAPFVRFKTSTGDNSMVMVQKKGNGFLSIDESGNRLLPIVDPEMVFGDDASLLTYDNFLGSDKAFLRYSQQIENKLPSAMSYFKATLKPGESYRFLSLFGTFEDEDSFRLETKDVSYAWGLKQKELTRELIEDLIAPCEVHTSFPLFDLACKQSYLDNNLRGGFPVLLKDGKKGQPYYLFGRKHGDMERDYNAFQMPSRYYSSGPGNFRDVNQNRRSDLVFSPFVGDYNIRLFFTLIQADGQNPLNVQSESFVLEEGADLSFLGQYRQDEKLLRLLKRYRPNELYTYLIDGLKLEKSEADFVFSSCLGLSHQEVEGNFGEGYWVDHWTYNVDLLESYSSLFPDKEEALFFEKPYPYFYSPVFVEPRSEKYCLSQEGKPRQYGAIDLEKTKKWCENHHFDLSKTAYLSSEEGKVFETNLAGKMINLILVKFSTLDSKQLGIEMECEKPGWNDAMNGLPGLFASGLSETVELLRLVEYSLSHLSPFAEKTMPFLKEQKSFLDAIEAPTNDFIEGRLGNFPYWDAMTSARETLRASLQEHCSGESVEVKVGDLLPLLSKMRAILLQGIRRAKEIGGGILPSYLIYEPSTYKRTGKKNHLGLETIEVYGFHLVTIPPFLEASARAFKLGKEAMGEADYQAIKASGIYDEKLHFYKTCAPIDDAPFEIGRVHAFTKGWLERECNFLHMDYKYLLGLLKGGFYEDFYAEIPTNLVPFLDPNVYGRNPAEASSFIVPTCNPNQENWGRGFFARLTGANAEFLNMLCLLFLGDKPFSLDNGTLKFSLQPKLSAEFFDEKGEASFLLFGKTKIIYHNPKRLDCYKGVSLLYSYSGKTASLIEGEDALAIREGKIERIDVEIGQ